jgi:hypothetical protein
VEWFNTVDATYRSNLRELNETNFARFEAKLDQRVSACEARIKGLEVRMNSRFTALDEKMDSRFTTFGEKTERCFAEFSERIAHSETRMIRWMVGTILAAAAIVVAAQRL